MDTCKAKNGSLFDCTADCALPWLCPASQCFDAARAEYVRRNREAMVCKMRRAAE